MATEEPKRETDKDARLIRAINRGEAGRFGDLVARYQDRLYNFGLRLCNNVQDAEDLVQETFLNVFRHLDGFRHETRFKNWLYRIAGSVCIKKRRRSKFAPEPDLPLEDFMPREGDSLPERPPDWAVQPLDRLLDEELSAALREKIAALPEKYRLVVVLRDIEGFSTEETAGILGISPANVKVRLHRGRLALREALKGYFDHDPSPP
jgi:RNA polymerase sigma-70 factor, ECF subfamily